MLIEIRANCFHLGAHASQLLAHDHADLILSGNMLQVIFRSHALFNETERVEHTGQSREMVAHYSRQVNQSKLAAAAI